MVLLKSARGQSFYIGSRAVHGSVRVGFGLNPDSTRSSRVEQKRTRNRPLTTTGRVGRAQGSKRSGQSSLMMSDGERRRRSLFVNLS